ncbi:ABC transporter ATP-binding protein [Terriglobus saanensis]|uniref:ABC transporter related protein n=1 Tax=Terriglobus saanensis (strain ATCC BAA-1853 / DSM 23119 / SP1PR4) TaxID=401053 RepID=E8UYC5_TERSS|nr:ATP-binding cassette domain-containing protein [Terriglobus saanensis]ADV82013.1 ABC transporter related protein [Terriglobus saanensis SP1PR4]
MLELTLQGERGRQTLEVHLVIKQPWTVLFGASGAGKSSILRAIAGLWQPPATRVLLDEKDISHLSPDRRRIPLVTHHAALFPHMTARENLLFPLKGESTALADELLQRFQVEHVRDSKPATLSSGERQRVALARAIASRPRLLLLDEALSGLDILLRTQLIAELKNWQADSGALILSVTHNLSETLESADEVARLEDSRITQVGPAREVLSDRREHLLHLLGN